MEATARRCRIGLVCGGNNAALLRSLLGDAGYRIEPALRPAQLAAWLDEAREQPDLWLLDESEADDLDQPFALIAERDTPFLINDVPAPLADPVALRGWRERLLDKVDETVAAHVAPAGVHQPPAMVWVLAASTGGPEAMRAFLGALPRDLPIALVYAQHIVDGFDDALAQSLQKQFGWTTRVCRDEQRLAAGELLVIPSDRQVRFLPFHRVVEGRRPWAGRYRPAIDSVVAQLARMYQNRCGVIVFSGLCDDGALGCRMARVSGAEVWVQTPASCISPEMPLAVLATGSVTFQGTPAELAEALGRRCQRAAPVRG